MEGWTAATASGENGGNFLIGNGNHAVIFLARIPPGRQYTKEPKERRGLADSPLPFSSSEVRIT